MNFKTYTFSAVLSVTSLGLVSCSSKVSKEDCESPRIYNVGVKDGGDGKAADASTEFLKTCGGFGVQDSDAKYRQGRAVGLGTYCSASRGESDAKDGKTDSTCQKENFPPYVSAYQKQMQKLNDERNSQIKDLEAEKSKKQQQEVGLQNKINDLNSKKK